MGMDALNNVSFQPQSKPVAEVHAAPAVDVSSVPVNAASAPAAEQGKSQQQSQSQPTKEEIQKAINAANKKAYFGHTNAQFSYHEETHSIAVKIMDAETSEVIKEIPSEETLEMISKMWELAGIMVDERR
ncbi:MAG: flagellar protein FlaG [Lachnospiraceae bacterium]|nr:flagellar protein FlaG [Lachnospiraceae bacterium]